MKKKFLAKIFLFWSPLAFSAPSLDLSHFKKELFIMEKELSTIILKFAKTYIDHENRYLYKKSSLDLANKNVEETLRAMGRAGAIMDLNPKSLAAITKATGIQYNLFPRRNLLENQIKEILKNIPLSFKSTVSTLKEDFKSIVDKKYKEYTSVLDNNMLQKYPDHYEIIKEVTRPGGFYSIYSLNPEYLDTLKKLIDGPHTVTLPNPDKNYILFSDYLLSKKYDRYLKELPILLKEISKYKEHIVFCQVKKEKIAHKFEQWIKGSPLHLYSFEDVPQDFTGLSDFGRSKIIKGIADIGERTSHVGFFKSSVSSHSLSTVIKHTTETKEYKMLSEDEKFQKLLSLTEPQLNEMRMHAYEMADKEFYKKICEIQKEQMPYIKSSYKAATQKIDDLSTKVATCENKLFKTMEALNHEFKSPFHEKLLAIFRQDDEKIDYTKMVCFLTERTWSFPLSQPQLEKGSADDRAIEREILKLADYHQYFEHIDELNFSISSTSPSKYSEHLDSYKNLDPDDCEESVGQKRIFYPEEKK